MAALPLPCRGPSPPNPRLGLRGSRLRRCRTAGGKTMPARPRQRQQQQQKPLMPTIKRGKAQPGTRQPTLRSPGLTEPGPRKKTFQPWRA